MARVYKTSTVPGAYGISRQTFEEIEDAARSFHTGSREFQKVMNVAAEALAKTNHAYIRRYYTGPYTRPSMARRGLGASPGTIPVRRLTQKTLRGWRVRQIVPGAWELFNNERGAFFVEYGIVKGGGGRPRPVLKMSAVATLRFIQRTRFAERIMDGTLGNLKNNHGNFTLIKDRGVLFSAAAGLQHVQHYEGGYGG